MRGEKVLITGAGGALAKKVKKLLLKEGYIVVMLTTSIRRCDDSTFYWNVEKGKIDHNSFENCKHIIHLAGYSIVKPWTSTNQKKMYDSRVKAAKLLLDTCVKYKIKLKTFISASAIGYYNSDVDEPKNENDLPGENWLAKLARDWEASAYQFQKNNVRVVCMRISLLLDLKSGFLKPLVLSAKLGCGTIFGNKSNIIEWIHINDATREPEQLIAKTKASLFSSHCRRASANPINPPQSPATITAENAMTLAAIEGSALGMLKLSGSSDWFDDDSDSSTTSAWYSDVGLNRQPVANSLHAKVDRGRRRHF